MFKNKTQDQPEMDVNYMYFSLFIIRYLYILHSHVRL